MIDLTKVLATVDDMRPALANMLPRHIPVEQFRATVEAALRNNPDILQADPLSINVAITQAAEDGMKPDGREGIITVYNEKRIKKERGKPDREYWVKTAKWTPMLLGITKHANDHGILLDAQVVCENDDIDLVLGTQPQITHRVDVKKPRGKMIGAYAVFKAATDKATLHVEYMDATAIGQVKSCSKNAKGLLWTKFEDQAWCKSVIRRGSKRVRSLPSSLLRAIERDDDQYTFDAPPAAAPQIAPRLHQQALPPPPPSIADIESKKPVPAEITDAEPSPQPQEVQRTPGEKFLDALGEKLAACKTLRAAEQVWSRNENTIENKLTATEKAGAYVLWDTHASRLTEAA